jgi:uncharacterized protein YecE (DUF72 family)
MPRHPLLRSVGIDRTFYAPIAAAEFAHYARQVPAGFRFLVKAPAQCVSPWLRAEHNGRTTANPHYLDPQFAAEKFVLPASEGLGDRAGPLVFQFPPMGRVSVSQSATFAQRLRDFLTCLPSGPSTRWRFGTQPC